MHKNSNAHTALAMLCVQVTRAVLSRTAVASMDGRTQLGQELMFVVIRLVRV